MSTPPSSEQSLKITTAYYDTHAETFAANTAEVDMAHLYAPFLVKVPTGGHILDAGCGSGRDSLAFLRAGYRVTAMDASVRLATLTTQRTGVPVRVQNFRELEDEAVFDGVWACASLLHVPRGDLLDVLRRMSRSLKPGGVLYASFKYGTFEGIRNGRFFQDYTEEGIGDVLQALPTLRLIDTRVTTDVRTSHVDVQWLNVFAERI